MSKEEYVRWGRLVEGPRSVGSLVELYRVVQCHEVLYNVVQYHGKEEELG